MKTCLYASFALLLASACAPHCDAFLPIRCPPFGTNARTAGSPLGMVDLEPEPEGGEEIAQIDTMPGSRMKNMGLCDETKSKDGSEVYNFWLSAEAEGKLIKDIRTTVEKEASRKANFPGFRKVW